MRDSASKSKVERGWGRLLMLTSGSHMHTHTHTCTQDHIYMFSKAKQQQQQKLQQCGEADWAHLYPRVPFPHWQDSSLLLYFWIFGRLILQPLWFLLSSQGISHSCVYLFDDCSRNLLLRTLLGVGDTYIHSDRSPSWEASASSTHWLFNSTCNRLFQQVRYSRLWARSTVKKTPCAWIDAFCREMLCIRWWAQGYRWGHGRAQVLEYAHVERVTLDVAHKEQSTLLPWHRVSHWPGVH